MRTRIFRIFYWSGGDLDRHEVGTADFFTGDGNEIQSYLNQTFGLGWESEVGWEEIEVYQLRDRINSIEETIYQLRELIESAYIAEAKFEDS